ncbi:hypothetical protein PVL29_009016 [Vitis rotundifolia]|uniref:Uncharacterized protein n=1 Tax=Vitis rotundifolia TaxID=103349 RepID=A0AA38ZXD0_VITRO|nr:hypothetical protein PVL29_009016 [Vitis rotundifolia]
MGKIRGKVEKILSGSCNCLRWAPLPQWLHGEPYALARYRGLRRHRVLYGEERERGDDLRHRLRHRRLMVPKHQGHCIPPHRCRNPLLHGPLRRLSRSILTSYSKPFNPLSSSVHNRNRIFA